MKSYDIEDNKSNYQYPKSKEVFEIVLVGKNFLILKDKDGNNLRVKTEQSSLYSAEEKIYKENGIFLWEKA